MDVRKMKRMAAWPALAAVTMALALGWPAAAVADEAPPVKMNTTADHSKFKELDQVFKSGPEVTKACLSCHTEAAKQVHRTKHWTWEFLNPENKQKLGKKNVLNNFCISIESNYAGCTACHVGYGWKDASFDFTKEENVDCLVCHDTTGGYSKPPGLAGNPVVGQPIELPPGSGKMMNPVDLAKVAKKVGKTSRDTCGACHFRGGGGDGVKHGDMDTSLAAPEGSVDIHMDASGLDFTCGTCHKTSSHDVPGSRYTPTAQERAGASMRGKEYKGNPATCVACHSNTPHKNEARLNSHATKLACQTCHIPAFARGGIPTKMVWDWSTAGKLKDGKQFTVKDEKGHAIYASHKGDFVLGENVVPEYRWFNGQVTYTLLGDKIEKGDKPLGINKINGSPTDGKSQIWPMKIMRGKQPFDPEYKTLVKPHTAGNDDTGYWKNLDWVKAVEAGMKGTGQPFSGKVDFIETEMYWPTTHMVAAKDKAVACADCHSAKSRLAGLPGIYMPSYSAKGWLDLIGWLLAAATFAGVLLHGALRVYLGRKG